MKIKLSTLLTGLGLLLVLTGFLYELQFAGIPYQDPPFELAAQYNRHEYFAIQLKWLGGGVIVAGLVARLRKK